MTSRQPYWCSNTVKQRPRYVGKSTKCFMMISPRILSLYEAVTRWWSLATFTPLGTSTSLSERRLLRLNTKGSLWLWSRPFGEHHVSLWIALCGKRCLSPVTEWSWCRIPTAYHQFTLHFIVVIFWADLCFYFTRNEKKTLVGSFPNFRFVEA